MEWIRILGLPELTTHQTEILQNMISWAFLVALRSRLSFSNEQRRFGYFIIILDFKLLKEYRDSYCTWGLIVFFRLLSLLILKLIPSCFCGRFQGKYHRLSSMFKNLTSTVESSELQMNYLQYVHRSERITKLINSCRGLEISRNIAFWYGIQARAWVEKN